MSDPIARRIASFPRWHYQFNLAGHVTPIFDERHVNRHEQRRKYFFEPVVSGVYGGTLAGRRVLDLGCNAGYWSLLAAQAGAEQVVGLDGRRMHVEQAEFVLETSGIARERYRFLEANVFDFNVAGLGSFDVVFCLGLLYHVSKPVELLELIANTNASVVVLDTDMSPVPGPFLQVHREKLKEARNAVDHELVFRPSRQAVLRLTQQFGFDVTVLRPRFSDWTGCLDYRDGTRRAFIGTRGMPKPNLDVEQANAARKVVGLARWAKRRLGKVKTV